MFHLYLLFIVDNEWCSQAEESNLMCFYIGHMHSQNYWWPWALGRQKVIGIFMYTKCNWRSNLRMKVKKLPHLSSPLGIAWVNRNICKSENWSKDWLNMMVSYVEFGIWICRELGVCIRLKRLLINVWIASSFGKWMIVTYYVRWDGEAFDGLGGILCPKYIIKRVLPTSLWELHKATKI